MFVNRYEIMLPARASAASAQRASRQSAEPKKVMAFADIPALA